MRKRRSRFPKRWAWRVVTEIMLAAQDLDPGEPDWRTHTHLNSRAFALRQKRHYDLVAIERAAIRLRDEIAVMG